MPENENKYKIIHSVHKNIAVFSKNTIFVWEKVHYFLF